MLEEPGDVERMGSRAAAILANPDEWQRYSNAAVERAKQFAADSIVPQYEQLYHEVLEA